MIEQQPQDYFQTIESVRLVEIVFRILAEEIWDDGETASNNNEKESLEDIKLLCLQVLRKASGIDNNPSYSVFYILYSHLYSKLSWQ